MKWTVLHLCLALFAVGAFTNCATIVHGSRQGVSVSSMPSGAAVKVNGQHMGTTPATLKLKRKAKNQRIDIELDGYEPYQLVLTRKVSGWYAGNLVFGGIIGLIVDPITGGMYKLDPDEIHAELRNLSTGSLGGEDHLFIAVALEVDPSWEKVGQLQRIVGAR